MFTNVYIFESRHNIILAINRQLSLKKNLIFWQNIMCLYLFENMIEFIIKYVYWSNRKNILLKSIAFF